MTRLPSESWAIEAMTGEMFPRYKVKPMCAVPDCTKFVDHSHHITRRSFIGGDIAWVKFEGGDIVGNLCGLCYHHHEEVTKGYTKILYVEGKHRYEWCRQGRDGWQSEGVLYPHPPAHGQVDEEESGEPGVIGPGSRPICPGCKRPLPHSHEETKREKAKRRKTWTVQVPDETEEDGALVLSTLLEECASLFGRDLSQPNLRYYVLAQALALVVQNGHLLG